MESEYISVKGVNGIISETTRTYQVADWCYILVIGLEVVMDMESTGEVQRSSTQERGLYNGKSSGQVGECVAGHQVGANILYPILYDNANKWVLGYKCYLICP